MHACTRTYIHTRTRTRMRTCTHQQHTDSQESCMHELRIYSSRLQKNYHVENVGNLVFAFSQHSWFQLFGSLKEAVKMEEGV